MTRRDAVSDDIPAVVGLLREFHAAVDPGFAFDAEHTTKTVTGLIWSHFGFVRVFGDPIAGAILAVATQSPWGRFLVASEIAWWVTPAHRGSRHSTGLLSDFEAWAAATECRIASVTVLDDRIGHLLDRRGYRAPETTYRKALPWR